MRNAPPGIFLLVAIVGFFTVATAFFLSGCSCADASYESHTPGEGDLLPVPDLDAALPMLFCEEAPEDPLPVTEPRDDPCPKSGSVFFEQEPSCIATNTTSAITELCNRWQVTPRGNKCEYVCLSQPLTVMAFTKVGDYTWQGQFLHTEALLNSPCSEATAVTLLSEN